MRRFVISCVAMLCVALSAGAAVTVKEQGGWFESAFVTWAKTAGREYNVYVSPASSDSWTKLDDELVREYPDYGRADALGLSAGSYRFKVVPVSDGEEVTAEATVSAAVEVKAHDRSGFAHVGMSGGIGAYKNDGTLKDGAKVIYVWADNAKTVTLDVTTNNKGGTTTGKGLQDIVYLYQKGYETTPLSIRIIGTIKDGDMDRFDSSAEGLQVKGKGAYADMPITIEGVGNDAAIWGFGILCRNASDVEFRNFAIMLCKDDCLSLDTGNSNIWVHNMDFFYGNTGGDSDQAKGDGTVDIKGKSMNITVSYNHFIDCGKTSLGGMKSETTDCWMSYHHNWFDHSDSRHPRIRTAFYHVYNNYFDGVSKYGVGVTSGGSSFVENNYFRNCKYPMLISKQGTDAEGDGTFSGENGGVIKAYNNLIVNARKVQYYDGSQTDGKWDAVLVNSRADAVSAKAFTGGTSYNSSADNAARSTYMETNMDEPEAVKGIVKGEYGAGRMQHGDFKWTFNNSLQDENYGVIGELKSALQSYQSTLVGFFDGETVSNGGATKTVDAGDGKNLSEEQNDSYVPTWAGGSGSGTVSAGQPDTNFYGQEAEGNFYWFNSSNDANTQALILNLHLSYSDGSAYNATAVPAPSSDGSASTTLAGYVGVVKDGGHVTFKCDNGLSSISAKIFRTGNATGQIQVSKDGTTFTKIGDYSEKKGERTINASTFEKEGPVYVRITNAATGTLYIQGVKIMYPDPNGTADNPTPETPDSEDPDEDTRSNDATADFKLADSDINLTNNAYTMNVAWDATETSYSVEITPAENATVTDCSGATGSGNSYTIVAPAAGQTATATFTITAENGTTTRTYTIRIVKDVDPSTITVETGKVNLQSDNVPTGYKLDGTGNVSGYTYNSDLCKDAKLISVSAGQHTVTLPAGAKVTKIVMYAVNDNNTANKGKITELAGQTFAVDLPSRKTGTAFATATVDNVSITGQFTFTVTYKAGIKFELTVESTDGIAVMTTDDVSNAVAYDLQGRRVSTLQPGKVYIVNGKKFVK